MTRHRSHRVTQNPNDNDNDYRFTVAGDDAGKRPEAIRAVMEGARLELAFVEGSEGTWLLEQYSPIKGVPACFTAACHFHKETTAPLGVLYTSYDISGPMHLSKQILMGTLLAGAILVVTLSIVLFFSIYKFVTKPVAVIEAGMRRLGEGDFDHPIELKTRDEMGRLASNFNAMSEEIGQRA